MNSGFVYKWTDSTNNKTYIGSHMGSINDGYIGSGTFFRAAYKKRPQSFSREILEYAIKDLILETEQKYLDQIEWDNTYNLSSGANGGHTTAGFTAEQMKEHGRKISNSLKGKSAGMLGKKHSTGTKIQQSKSHKGKQFSKEHKQKISESHKGNISGMLGKKTFRRNKTKN